MIVCFTGTGNSMMAARLLALSLGSEPGAVVELKGEMLRNPSETVLSAERGEEVVWVFPVYSWGVPPVVEKFIKGVKMEGSMSHAVHHAVITYGDDAGRTPAMWRKILTSRCARPGGVYGVKMPNIYVLMKGFDVDPESVAELKLAMVPGRMEEIARKIKANPRGRWETDVIAGSFARIKSGVIYPWFVRHAMSPKPFHSTESCIGCGKCSRSCPMDNIAMTDMQRPSWGEQCALCLRCYHICPVHAVAYGKATRGKGQYLCPTLKEIEIIKT